MDQTAMITLSKMINRTRASANAYQQESSIAFRTEDGLTTIFPSALEGCAFTVIPLGESTDGLGDK